MELNPSESYAGNQLKQNEKGEIFSRYAISYDKIVAQASYYQKLVDNCVRDLRGCKNVVDIGCGTGNVAIRLAEMGINVLAIDNDDSMLERAKDKVLQRNLGARIKFQKKDINEIELEEDAFDGACMINVLYWLEKPFHALDKVYRSLKQGGIFVVSGPKPTQNAQILIRETLREFQEKGIAADLKDDLEIFEQVNKALARDARNFFTTSRLSEILLDFVGFSDVIASDLRKGYRTYFGQGYYLAVKKAIDFSRISFDKISIRLAKGDEIQKIYRIRYHFMKERLSIIAPQGEQERMKMEFDEFDASSDHIIAKSHGKILSVARIVRDSRLKLPMDFEHCLDYLREKGEMIWEPGRWIRLPFAPRGIGRKVWMKAYEHSKAQGATYWVSLFDENHLAMCRKMGYKMDTLTPSNIKGLKRKAYIEIFPIDSPPEFFRED